MKKLMVFFGLAVLLCGCAAQETFETVQDVYGQQEITQPAQMEYIIPNEAQVQVLRSDAGCLYLCDGYEMAVEVMESGDLDRTVQALTGYAKDTLTMLETGTSAIGRFECAWASVGEGGDQIGRTVILDDGRYHYCISLTALAEEAGPMQETWQEILSSFCLKT